MNLNWARIKLREKENQLSSWYDRGQLYSVIIFRKRRNILERYDTRKHVEVWFNLSCGGTTNVIFLCFYVSLELASVLFLLARSWRKTDGHIIKIRMFFKLYMFFFAYRQGLKQLMLRLSIDRYWLRWGPDKSAGVPLTVRAHSHEKGSTMMVPQRIVD